MGVGTGGGLSNHQFLSYTASVSRKNIKEDIALVKFLANPRTLYANNAPKQHKTMLKHNWKINNPIWPSGLLVTAASRHNWGTLLGSYTVGVFEVNAATTFPKSNPNAASFSSKFSKFLIEPAISGKSKGK